MIYKRSPYAHALPDRLDYQVVGERLEHLRETLGAGFAPSRVVEDARPEDSPLHEAGFTWDATEAHQKLLEQEAAYLVRNVISIDTGPDGVERTTRAFVSIVERESQERRYLPIVTALSDDEYREQILHTALKEALSWRRKYDELREFARIFEAIDRTAKRIEKRSIAKAA